MQEQARGVIERQVGKLKHLVDDLLDVSRITTGRVELRREPIIFSDIVERAIEAAQPLIVQRRHEFVVALGPRPIWLNADSVRLEQVLVNLLTNAAMYTNEGGRIWLSLEQEGETAVLRLRDDGIGIAPELLPRIFNLFTQAQQPLDRTQGGLGIGLSLVQQLVELHGGSVSAQSVLGQGSEFTVRLPVVQPVRLQTPPAALEQIERPTRSSRVLVVEDNVDLAQSLAVLLEVHGHDVAIVHDGLSALDAALEHRADVVLLDIGLPGLNGFEVATRIRRHPALENVVLVAMTGYAQESDRERARESGFDYHLAKPADFDRVLEILASVSRKGTAA